MPTPIRPYSVSNVVKDLPADKVSDSLNVILPEGKEGKKGKDLEDEDKEEEGN